MAMYLRRICLKTARLLSFPPLSRQLLRFDSRFEVDVMDEFTSQLMQRKLGKWDQQKRKNEALMEKMCHGEEEKILKETNVENLSQDEINFMFQNLVDDEDLKSLMYLMRICVKCNKSPKASILISVLSSCAQQGDVDMVLKIQTLCETHHPYLLDENSRFRHFLAEAIWMKGDVSKALTLFENTYRENAYLRRRIRLMLKYLIFNLVATGSGAALENMIGFSERTLRDFQDCFPMTYVWQACFLSEWFTDQCIALELLEKHSGLCKAVINRIPYVVFVSLKCHRTEVVYRLLEILLKYKMKQQYSSVLATLLDYQFRFGDLGRCAEILRWAANNDVALPKKQHIKMINLILNQKLNTPLAPIEKEKEQKPKYDFKF